MFGQEGTVGATVASHPLCVSLFLCVSFTSV